MRILQILLAVFLVLYAINIYVNRPSVPRQIVVNNAEINTGPLNPIHVTVDR